MAGRRQHIRSFIVALAIVWATLSGIVEPLLDSKIANVVVGVTAAYADESEGHGG